ncbi:hypothetical protein LTR17_008874 [Elasticomyces elasticus]|nr:hypothetical protein LTR17_008874 [Elasticomyces elasticus]
MSRRTPKSPYTGPWWNNKQSGQTTDDNRLSAIVGWGLQGCNIEEYPFRSGNPDNSAVLRLVPEQENSDHGEDLNAFYKVWDGLAGDPNLDGQAKINSGRKANLENKAEFKIVFESGVADQSTEWGLTNNAAGNVCAEPYGTDFLLVGGGPKKKNAWDPYFARQGRMKTYTSTTNGRNIIGTMPPQYCTVPSPGRRALVGGAFESINEDNVQIGIAALAPDPNDIGWCEPWPPVGGARNKVMARMAEPANLTLPKQTDAKPQQKAPFHPRHAPALTFRDQLIDVGGRSVVANASSLARPQRKRHSNGLTVRQLSGGSYLDPNVYAFLDCSNDDYDPCDWGQTCGETDGEDSGDDSGDDGSATTTAGSPTVTSSVVTSESSAATTDSSPSTIQSSSAATTSATTRTTTIYVLSTETITSTSQVISTLGAMTITANIRTQVVANAIAQVSSTTTTQSQITLAPRANFIVSDYNLNYIASHTGTSTFDVCSAGNFDVYGVGKPKPDHWYDYPASVSFVSTISLDDTGVKLSSCSYTNPAAPSAGDGGELACGSTTYPCIPYLFGPATFYCNYDDLAGYMTTMDILAECVVTTTGETVFTTTSVATATSVSVIVS